MTTHSSATALEETPHETETTTLPIGDALRYRARSVISDISIDPQWRTIIRYALELKDPWLPDLVQRAEGGENIVDTFESLRTLETNEDEPTATRSKLWQRPSVAPVMKLRRRCSC